MLLVYFLLNSLLRSLYVIGRLAATESQKYDRNDAETEPLFHMLSSLISFYQTGSRRRQMRRRDIPVTDFPTAFW